MLVFFMLAWLQKLYFTLSTLTQKKVCLAQKLLLSPQKFSASACNSVQAAICSTLIDPVTKKVMTQIKSSEVERRAPEILKPV